MNSVVILLVAVVFAVGAYYIYAKRVDRGIFQSDERKATPAKMYMDGVEFIPASRNVLWGYQFKSIAATGPVTGAIMAASQWGWLPSLLWLLLGVVFIGWLHDYGSAFIALRNDGQTFSGMSYRMISPRARSILLIFIYLYLLLIMGAFVNMMARAMVPGYVPLAIIAVPFIGLLAGQMIYRWKVDILLTTAIMVVVALVIVWISSLSGVAGIFNAIDNKTVLWGDPKAFPVTPAYVIWSLFVMVFCYLGATLPIWRWAQPINYVSFYVIAIAIVVAAIGILVGHPDVTMPGFAGWNFDTTGTTYQGLWPLLFVTIACGAVSGWHGLASSSGTARQLERETDALPVCGGAMLAEMVMGVIALLTAVTAYKTQGELAQVGIGNPGGVFSAGVGSFMGYLGIDPKFGSAFGAIIFVLLAITVIQLVLRFMRVCTAEFAGEAHPALGNPHVATVIASVLSIIFVWTGSFAYIWPLFGGANQLMASLALLLISIWLISNGKRYDFVLIPAVFMFITTTVAELVTGYNVTVSKIIVPLSKGQGVGIDAWIGTVGMDILAIFLVVAAVILGNDALAALRRVRTSLQLKAKPV